MELCQVLRLVRCSTLCIVHNIVRIFVIVTGSVSNFLLTLINRFDIRFFWCRRFLNFKTFLLPRHWLIFLFFFQNFYEFFCALERVELCQVLRLVWCSTLSIVHNIVRIFIIVTGSVSNFLLTLINRFDIRFFWCRRFLNFKTFLLPRHWLIFLFFQKFYEFFCALERVELCQVLRLVRCSKLCIVHNIVRIFVIVTGSVSNFLLTLINRFDIRFFWCRRFLNFKTFLLPHHWLIFLFFSKFLRIFLCPGARGTMPGFAVSMVFYIVYST